VSKSETKEDVEGVNRFRSSDYPAPIGPMEEMFVENTGAWRSQRPETEEGLCRECGRCFLFCPTGSRFRDEAKGCYSTDLDFCKGCGICAEECPIGAIKIVPERRE